MDPVIILDFYPLAGSPPDPWLEAYDKLAAALPAARNRGVVFTWQQDVTALRSLDPRVADLLRATSTATPRRRPAKIASFNYGADFTAAGSGEIELALFKEHRHLSPLSQAI